MIIKSVHVLLEHSCESCSDAMMALADLRVLGMNAYHMGVILSCSVDFVENNVMFMHVCL